MCFILNLIEISVLFLMVDIVSWLVELRIGIDVIIVYFVDSLCRGICVVFLIEWLLLLWLMMKILLEVLIKIVLYFIWKFWSFMVCGMMMCWFEGIFICFLVMDFNEVFRWWEVVMFIWILFLDVIYIFFVVLYLYFMNKIINVFFLFFKK